MKRGSARANEDAVAEDQALVVQLAEGAGECHAAGEAPGIRENPIGKRWERQHVRVLAKNHSHHGPLHLEVSRHLRTVRRTAAAGCSTWKSPST